MIHTRMFGDVKVTNLVEYFGPTHDPAVVFPTLDRKRMDEAVRTLDINQYVPGVNRFVVAIQIWIVQHGDQTIIIDTGVGNFKKRPAARMNMLNTLVPEWLAAAGVDAASVTHVVNTHLHSDHVGWNTRLSGDEWVPTFPNARYYLPTEDYQLFKDQYDSGNTGASAGSFADSVLPVVDKELVEFVDGEGRIADLLEIEPVPGHTPGQFSLRLQGGGREGIFCADVFHSPIQIVLPDVNTAFCMLPELAIETRHAFLQRAASRGALIMPCHFGYPHCGYARGSLADGYRFEPEGTGAG